MKKFTGYTGIGAAVIAALFLLGSCGAGLSVEEAEGIRTEVEEVKSRMAAVESTLAGLQDTDDEEISEAADTALQELSEILSRLEGIEDQLEIPEPAAEDPMGDPAGAGGADPLQP